MIIIIYYVGLSSYNYIENNLVLSCFVRTAAVHRLANFELSPVFGHFLPAELINLPH